LSRSTPFKVVFDEIITLDHHSFKMHAVPTNQCSMVTDGGRLRSIEVTAGGIVRNPDFDSPVLLGKGDELVVKISRERSYFKAKSETPPLALSAGKMSPLTATPNKLDSSSSTAEEVPDMVIATRVKPEASPAPAAGGEASSDDVTELKPSMQSKDSAWVADADKSNAAAGKTSEEKIAPAEKIASKENSKIESASSNEDKELNTAEKAKEDSEKETESPAEKEKKRLLEIAKAQAYMNEQGLTADGTISKNFKVEFVTPLSTQASHADDQVLGVLKEDMTIGTKVVAKKGSALLGHVVAIRQSCRWGQAMKAKGQKNATMTIQFDRLVTTDEKVLPILGTTPEQEVVFKNAGVFKTLTVSPEGEICKDLPMNFSEGSQTSGLVQIAAMTMMGPQAAIAAPLILIGALGKARPAITKSIQKTVVGKGDEVLVYPGDQISVQARLLDPVKEELYVAGKVIHGKNLKTIRTAESHPSVE
jgi:hypothetical protein